jgi:cytochrome c oxidase subunit 2
MNPSALDPAGRGAEQLAALTWALLAGAAVIWIAVVALALYAYARKHEAHGDGGRALPSTREASPTSSRTGGWLIVGGGVVCPAVVLIGLLAYSLAMLPGLIAPAPPGSPSVLVIGEQWWWRVLYLREGEPPIPVANEIRLPVGQPVQFLLESRDVVHSFWIPPLGGKTDMIPGRRTRLLLEPTRTGVFRGACAEYCGASHAHMAFAAVVHEVEDYARWIALQAQPAAPPADPVAAAGARVFEASGCGACHAVRGTAADGVVGPDLTHVAGRLTIGAGMLPVQPDSFYRWVSRTAEVKPAVHMPAFGMLPDADLRALAAYLQGLR